MIVRFLCAPEDSDESDSIRPSGVYIGQASRQDCLLQKLRNARGKDILQWQLPSFLADFLVDSAADLSRGSGQLLSNACWEGEI